MTYRLLAADLVVVVGWVLGIVAIEWAALTLGAIGCVTGSIALYKSMRALHAIVEFSREHSERISEIGERAAEIEERLTQ